MSSLGCNPDIRDLVRPYSLLLEKYPVGLHTVQAHGFLRMWGILLSAKQMSEKNLPLVTVEVVC